jgi:ParB-like chromosome segregation protein Spo0J
MKLIEIFAIAITDRQQKQRHKGLHVGVGLTEALHTLVETLHRRRERLCALSAAGAATLEHLGDGAEIGGHQRVRQLRHRFVGLERRVQITGVTEILSERKEDLEKRM